MTDGLAPKPADRRAFVRTVWTVAGITVLAGICETAAGYGFGSRYLVKDGIEWGYGAAIYAVSILTIGRGAAAERWGGYVIAAILAVGGVQSAMEIVERLRGAAETDAPSDLAASTAISLVVSLIVAAVLARFRRDHDPVVAGSWYAARNDAVSSTLDAAVTAIATISAATWLQTGSDLVGLLLSWQSAWVVAREASRVGRS